MGLKLKNLLVALLIIGVFFNISCSASTNEKSLEKSEPTPEGSRVSAQKILKQISKGENVFYKKITITGDLDFTTISEGFLESKVAVRSYIPVSVSFVDCIFEGSVTAFKKGDANEFNYVCFERNLSFINSTFMSEVNFKGVIVKGSVDFSGSDFFKKTVFEGAVFITPVINFNKTTFSDEVKFQRVVFDGDVTFMESKFEGKTSFQSSVFKGNMQFGASVFMKYADFVRIRANAGAFFNYTEFHDQVIFNSSDFNGRTEYMNAKFNLNTEFKRIKFGGNVKLCKASFTGKVDFTDSFFVIGKPDTSEIMKSDNLELILNNTFFSNTDSVVQNDF